MRNGDRTTSGTSTKKPRTAKKRAATIDPFYILAPSPQADESSRVLKHGETFAVYDHYGDIKPVGLGEEGLYHEGTRFLSGLVLRLDNERPLFLSSTVKEENELLAVDLTNTDTYRDGHLAIPRGTLHIFRAKFLWNGVQYERLRIRNYGLTPVETSFRIHFAADYVDIFEVRGTKRARRGRALPTRVEGDGVCLGYVGLDGVKRQTRLTFDPPPSEVNEHEARLAVSLPPRGEAVIFVCVACELDEGQTSQLSYDDAFALAADSLQSSATKSCELRTSNERFNDWIKRTSADLHMMTTDTAHGSYPYAGVPWFSTAFGRDGLITALECLWLNPSMARGVLEFLAATQAREAIPEQDAEPGKILHETRRGEMAALKEIPFGRYYGSVDATPLFVMLAAAYYARTGDRPFVERILPNVELALHWIDAYGDADGDGFVEYQRQNPQGLVHQGWKDSHDGVFHADGALAHAPIALCEVQGYVYAAKRGAAELALVRGRKERAEELQRQAQALQERFLSAFWCEDLGTYALALDGDKRPCRVRASNAGQCLFTGIAAPEHAERIAQALMSEDGFSGWGVRTVAASERRYNPMAYHNGSVWPHDNALIAAGLARYGLKDAAMRILAGMFDASLFVDLHRLPELFCGFARRPGEGPTLYPVACAPQSWAAGSAFMLLQASLGLDIRGAESQIRFCHPRLPESLREVVLSNLSVAGGSVDLLLQRHRQDVGLHVLRREGAVEILIVK
jgi:glycogen debranching enzyme